MSRAVGSGLFTHPFVLPVFMAWCFVAALVWRLMRRSRARAGRPAPKIAWLVYWCVFGGFVALTLTPGPPPVDLNTWRGTLWWHGHHCLPQWPRTGFGLWARNPERRWNVLLTIPLGLASGWLLAAAGSAAARFRAVALVVFTLLLPAGVEAGQALLPLDRVCAVVDAVDNVSGIMVGFALAGVTWMVSRVSMAVWVVCQERQVDPSRP